jgi:hypothetical protein
LVSRAAIALEDRPNVDRVIATVDDAGVRLRFVATLIECDCVPRCSGSCGNCCRSGEKSELHVGLIRTGRLYGKLRTGSASIKE